MGKKFYYSRWAKTTAAKCLQSDLVCGFEVADTTPDRQKAIQAMQKLIDQLMLSGQCEAEGGEG